MRTQGCAALALGYCHGLPTGGGAAGSLCAQRVDGFPRV